MVTSNSSWIKISQGDDDPQIMSLLGSNPYRCPLGTGDQVALGELIRDILTIAG